MLNNINKIKWTKKQLWEGCLLASIAHAIMVAHYPEQANEHSWDGMNYNIQDSSGTRGTVTFCSEYFVAAFRNEDSDRVSNIKQAKEYFEGSPKEITNIAETETLQYLLEDVEGKTNPLITTAIWGIGETLTTRDSFDDMLENGGYLLDYQAMDLRSAKEAWSEYYDMSSKQCKLMDEIFKRKIVNPKEVIYLSKSEIALIETDDPDGLEESRISFEEIGIEWE